MSRIEQLIELVSSYGQETISSIRLVCRFGHMLVEALPGYLGPRARVYGVPPSGAWQMEDYSDAMFSFYKKDLISLEPVDIGVAVQIPYKGDGGFVAVRTIVSVDVQRERLLVTVEGRSTIETLDIDDRIFLDEVCESVFQRIKSVFEDPIETVRCSKLSRIGF